MHANRFVVRPFTWFRPRSEHGRRMGFAALGLAASLTLGACASVQLNPAQPNLPTVGRVTLGLPAGDWVHVAHGSELLPATGEGVQAVPLKSRAVALRGSHGEVQAVLLVLANVDNNPTHVTKWGQFCPTGEDFRVNDWAKGSPERVDCLRSKTSAMTRDWLAKHEPAVVNWLNENKVPLPNAATWVSHQFANRAGMYVAVHMLADRRLLEPKAHNHEAFLMAGQPTVLWARELAKAVRVSTGMVDGRLDIPPFPMPQPVDPAPQAAVLETAAPSTPAPTPAEAASAPEQTPAAAPEPAPEPVPNTPERAQKADRG